MWEGINYLLTLNGQPRNGPGPAACGRVSCSGEDTAIYWCNDDTQPKTLESWKSIADGAVFRISLCSGDESAGFNEKQVAGQVFHWTNWNVIVKQETCNPN
ncbi:hypothetical protein TOPH_04595 [Tolypocladium ophioglossoides CBS 100239]|uniref:Uncharacterized protein n=1 Tax=Tolypocladium ophioglossoides (strain CBS 100239) TaxID=1163406 RepID=A0A0L0NA99_TOLOC|nr:hypothetical protein TOPH_04595 [Tolypocladium ophioglossoides CBS 100239]